MIYRFHPDLHGEVLAESKREDLLPWLGLHYPAQDIPKPARDIFEQVWIRPLPDASAPMFEMVPLLNPDTGKPLNMTYCALRAASVMYTEYLQNMGVTASLTMPIRRDSKLWGLVACHHYQPKPMPYQVRAACEFLAQIISVLIGSVEDREYFAYRLAIQELHGRLIVAASQQSDLKALVQGTPNLLDGIAAGGVALYQNEHWLTAGRTPSEHQLTALANWVTARPEWRSLAHPLYVSDCLSADYPAGKAFANVASGMLAIGLSQSSQHMLLWFRPETIQTIEWAGNPEDKPTKLGPNGPRLCPRSSFELFRESVRCKSLPWKEVEIKAALELRLNIMQVVISWAERLAALNAELLRSNQELDTFAYVASHDLKEPLRGISKYVYQLLESAKGAEVESRQRLERMAVLTQRMDSLLESLLNYSRIGRTQLAMVDTDLNEVVEEALEMVSARREENCTDIVMPRPLPITTCDRVRVREIFCNLLSNALKYNNKPKKRVEIGYIDPQEFNINMLRVPEVCARQRLFYVRDNGIGIQPRHYEQIFKMFKRLHGRDEYGGGNGAGLAIVEMLVERHDGRIWVDSIPDEETTFYFSLSGEEHKRLL
jgi:light-regulated signal transduction histidine kinase (bacteriophytochrome)